MSGRDRTGGARFACVLALAAAAAGPDAGAAESVTLTFAWPEGLAADVRFEGARTRFAGVEASTQSGRGRYRMATEAAPEGLRVRFHDVRLDAESLDAPGVQGEVQRLLAEAAIALPDAVVDGGGRVQRVVGVEALAARAEAALSALGGAVPPDARARIDALLARALAPPALEQRLAERWHRTVGAWAGATLERGRIYPSESSAPVATLGGVELPARTTREFVGPVPCADGREGPGPAACVHLRLRSALDPERAAEALAALVRSLAEAGAPGVEVRTLRVEAEVNLVTEAATLLPHRMTSERRTELELVRDGRPETTHEHLRRRVGYRYD